MFELANSESQNNVNCSYECFTNTIPVSTVPLKYLNTRFAALIENYGAWTGFLTKFRELSRCLDCFESRGIWVLQSYSRTLPRRRLVGSYVFQALLGSLILLKGWKFLRFQARTLSVFARPMTLATLDTFLLSTRCAHQDTRRVIHTAFSSNIPRKFNHHSFQIPVSVSRWYLIVHVAQSNDDDVLSTIPYLTFNSRAISV